MPPEQPVTVAPEQKPEAALPKQELSEEVLYEFVMLELASQRGHTEMASQVALDLAKKTRDPRIASRAAQLAFESRQMDRALEAFRLWQELEPTSLLSKRMLISMLLSGGKLDEARPLLVSLLATDKGNAGHIFMQINPMLTPYPDKLSVLSLVRELAVPYPQVAEAHWVVAQAALAKGELILALAEVQKARELRPDWDAALVLEAQVLMRSKPDTALDNVSRYLAKNPGAREVRLFYARALLEQKQYAQSREQFRQILAGGEDNTEIALAVALISVQMNELDEAEGQLKQLLAKGGRHQGAVNFYLGQLSEAKQRDGEALAYYQQVAEGENLYSAQLRAVFLLNKAGKLDAARAQVHKIQSANNQQRGQLVLIEAQLLEEAGQYVAKYQVLTQGLEKLPNHPELLYDAAMTAEKLGRLDIFEQQLRKLIQIRPDSAQAYNALGYGFLEHNMRLEEALQLVQKANQLAPDDPAILDSVGWGYFRAGKLTESLSYLRRAFAANPDPEIAAHLGEVLWTNGEKSEADKVLRDSLAAHPGNAVLQAVIKRLMP